MIKDYLCKAIVWPDVGLHENLFIIKSNQIKSCLFAKNSTYEQIIF